MTSSNPQFILKEIVAALSARLASIDPASIDAAYSSWIYPRGKNLISAIPPRQLVTSNYSHVAQLGYLIEGDPIHYQGLIEALKDGLNRILLRPAVIMGSPAPFCSDAVALLGIALGAKKAGQIFCEGVLNWMKGFPDLSGLNLPNWKKALIFTAFDLLGPSNRANIDLPSKGMKDMELALISRGVDILPDINFDEAYHAICSGSIYQDDELATISARLQAIEFLCNHLPAISLSQPKISQLVGLLNNITQGFRRWSWEERAKTSTGTPQRWDIQNEYHVQSVLYFLLAPIFPDIESEFYLENTGQLNPRADIGLPSLHLIIEVKFLRSTKNFQNMLEEIAADNTLYFQESSVYREKYSKMLVFLWDDSNRNHEHGSFRNGVNRFNNVIDSVVISRPGIMANAANVKTTSSRSNKLKK